MARSWKFLAVIAAALVLSGCIKRATDEMLTSDEFIQSGQGVVIMDPTQIEHYNGPRTSMFVEGTKPSGEKHRANIPLGGTPGDKAVEIVLPPGSYSIMSIVVDMGRATLMFKRNTNSDGQLMSGVSARLGLGTARPLATFSVGSGEVVNIGGLRAIALGKEMAIGAAMPMAPDVLESLKATKPKLAAAMVTRLMRTGSPLDAPVSGAQPADGAAKEIRQKKTVAER